MLDKKINELMLRFKNKNFNTSFYKITFETKTEIKKIADWLDVKYNDLMCKPSLGAFSGSKLCWKVNRFGKFQSK